MPDKSSRRSKKSCSVKSNLAGNVPVWRVQEEKRVEIEAGLSCCRHDEGLTGDMAAEGAFLQEEVTGRPLDIGQGFRIDLLLPIEF